MGTRVNATQLVVNKAKHWPSLLARAGQVAWDVVGTQLVCVERRGIEHQEIELRVAKLSGSVISMPGDSCLPTFGSVTVVDSLGYRPQPTHSRHDPRDQADHQIAMQVRDEIVIEAPLDDTATISEKCTLITTPPSGPPVWLWHLKSTNVTSRKETDE